MANTEKTIEQLDAEAADPRRELIKDTLRALYRPCLDIASSDDQLRPRQMLERINMELPIGIDYIETVQCLNELRFVRQSVQGELFWLVKFA